MVPELTYDKFVEILNKNLFGQEKAELIKKVASYPERYIGLFRPTTPKSKLLQNIFQSREIRFGNALEEVIREFIKSWGYQDIPNKKFTYGGEEYDLDQYFKDNGGTYYFIEQKVRDDHDSTKKRGQMDNFKAKLEYLHREHRDNLVGIFYFIDPGLDRNRRYYQKEIDKLKNKYQNVELHLFYGEQLFEYFNKKEDWNTLLKWLKSWKQKLPEFPEVDLDKDPEDSFKQLIKHLNDMNSEFIEGFKQLINWDRQHNDVPEDEFKHLVERLNSSTFERYWRRITNNNTLWEKGIIRELFPTGKTLEKVAEYFITADAKGKKQLGTKLKEKIKNYYSEQKRLSDQLDEDYEDSFKQLIEYQKFEDFKTYWKKIIKNEDLWEQGIIKVLFSEGTTLKRVAGYLINPENNKYLQGLGDKKLGTELKEKIKEYYS